ncbi:cofactor vestigial 2 [Argonauta hians]
MSCVDVMYQLYPSYLSYKGANSDDTTAASLATAAAVAAVAASNNTSSAQKYAIPSMYDVSSPGHYIHQGSSSVTKSDEEYEKGDQSKGSVQYLNPNCVLLTYFTGETSVVVDEHFTRSLNQVSSYQPPDRTTTKTSFTRPDVPLMCHRKFPASFWDSAYQSSTSSLPHSFHFPSDAYLNSSLYAMSSFHKTWPYSLASQTHSYAPQPAHTFSYSPMETAASRYSPHYAPFMMQSPAQMNSRIEPRHGQYDVGKSSDPFSSGYYPVSRLNGEMGSSFNLESSGLVSGIEVPVQQTKKEFYW